MQHISICLSTDGYWYPVTAKKNIYADVHKNMYILGVVCVVSEVLIGILSWLFIHLSTRPLKYVEKAIMQLKELKLEKDPKLDDYINCKSEVGQIATAIDSLYDSIGEMLEAEKEKQIAIAEREAKEAVWSGNVEIAGSLSVQGYSGTGYVEGFETDADACSFKVTIPESGFYDLNFVIAGIGGEKHNYVSVDGEQIGTVGALTSEFSDACLNRIYIEAGEHEISLSKYWGWIYLDCLKVLSSKPIDEGIYEVTAGLCNPNPI